jgi:hypothetical protein
MRHAREDYNRIQDPAGLIPEDEPVFLLRAKDVSAPFVVRHWATIAEQIGADPEIVASARMHARRMEAWQERYGFKPPDMPPGGAAQYEEDSGFWPDGLEHCG